MAGQPSERIRIRMEAYDHEVLDLTAHEIVDTATRTGAHDWSKDRQLMFFLLFRQASVEEVGQANQFAGSREEIIVVLFER